MAVEKKELFSPFELEGAYIMVSGLQKGKILHIAPEIRAKVQEKGLGFPLSEMTAAYFTSKQIKQYSKSELKKLQREKQKKKGIKDAVAKTKAVEAKVTKKAKKTKVVEAKKEVVEQEKIATNAALSWFTQVLADSLGGIQ